MSDNTAMKDDNPNMSLEQRKRISVAMKKHHRNKAKRTVKSIPLAAIPDPPAAKAKKRPYTKAKLPDVDALLKLEVVKLLNKLL